MYYENSPWNWDGNSGHWRSCKVPSCAGTTTTNPPWRSSPPRKYPEWRNAEWSSRSYPMSSLGCHPRFLRRRSTPIWHLSMRWSQGLYWRWRSIPTHTHTTITKWYNSNIHLIQFPCIMLTLWKRILPRSGLGSVSPEMTSSKSMSLSPLRKSSSMLSMAVPALRRWLLHQAVNVWKGEQECTVNMSFDNS